MLGWTLTTEKVSWQVVRHIFDSAMVNLRDLLQYSHNKKVDFYCFVYVTDWCIGVNVTGCN